MKKFILMFALMISAFVGANAQIAYQKADVFDNTSVTVQGGIASPMRLDHVTPFNAVAGVKLGKEFNPVFGMNVEGDVLFGKNDFSHSSTFVKSQYVGLNGTINLTNLFLGYNPSKTFVASIEGGAGWIYRYNNGNGYVNASNDNKTNHLGAKTGLIFGWNLGNAKQWQIFANPAVFWNLTDNGDGHKIQFNKGHAQLAVLAGITYKFKTSNGTHNFKTYDIGKMNDEINNLKAELAKKPKEVVREAVTTKVVSNQTKWVVFFEQGKSDLTNEAKDELNKIGENTIVDIVGHASSEGSEAFNQTLSENRAKAVADFLTKRGVKVNKVTGEGETGTPKNRVAIVKVAK